VPGNPLENRQKEKGGGNQQEGGKRDVFAPELVGDSTEACGVDCYMEDNRGPDLNFQSLSYHEKGKGYLEGRGGGESGLGVTKSRGGGSGC